MFDTIERNTFLAGSEGVHLHAFREGFPPCGVPLNPDGTVDTISIHGDQPGINEENEELGNKWGVMVSRSFQTIVKMFSLVWLYFFPVHFYQWADWTKLGKKKTPFDNSRGPSFRRGMHLKRNRNRPLDDQEVVEMPKPHDFNPFFAWWKHVPPQHPMMACFRPDTLYLIRVRHPKVWKKSLMKKSYGETPLSYFLRRPPWHLVIISTQLKCTFHQMHGNGRFDVR